MKFCFRSLFLLFLLLTPIYAGAVSTGVPFGGYVTSYIPCTCSTGAAVIYGPFFTGAPTPATGSLWLNPASLLYMFFVPGLPTSWDLGSYTPGVGGCWIIAPNPTDPCVPVPTLGSIQYMGTSITGASPYMPK
jgi:hypothetical protein